MAIEGISGEVLTRIQKEKEKQEKTSFGKIKVEDNLIKISLDDGRTINLSKKDVKDVLASLYAG